MNPQPPQLPAQSKHRALDRLATAQHIRKWREEGLLTVEQQEKAERLLCSGLDWPLWISRVLLLIATAFLLCGVVFFFAYNWAEIKPLYKFTLVEVAIAGCLVGAWWRGFRDLVGQMLLLAASVLVGVFLAVFGQIYQTGADSYTLFVAWSILIFPWVVLGRSGALWMFWLVLVNLAVGIYHSEMLDRQFPISPIMLLLNIFALSLRELAGLRGVQCCREEWQRWMLVLGIIGSMTVLVCLRILWSSDLEGGIQFVPIIWIVSAAGGFIFYRYVVRDLFAVSMLMLSVCVALTTLLGRGLFEGVNEPILLLFIMGVVTLMIFAFGFFILLLISRQMSKELQELHEKAQSRQTLPPEGAAT